MICRTSVQIGSPTMTVRSIPSEHNSPDTFIVTPSFVPSINFATLWLVLILM